jgi:DMSO reductase anchor subunit
MKITRDKFMIFCVVWAVIFWIIGFTQATFYFFPIALIPLAIYELIRTEGVHNTKPLSLLTLLVLILQILHTAKIFRFPVDLRFVLDLLPIPVPGGVDTFMLVSTILLIIFSLLLVKWTWGSVTKFIAILLLIGSVIEAWVFWPLIQEMIHTPQGQELWENQKEVIKDNIYYRLRSEFY